MYNITLVCTAHTEIGKCNSNELYQIIEPISPEVIFEELTKDLFDKVYKENRFPNESPEMKCIKKYLNSHDIVHIPVDINVNPNLLTNDIDYMFKTFEKYDIYKQIVYEHNALTAQIGFTYLNSKKCSDLFDKRKVEERNLIEFDINKNLLLCTHKLFYEEQDNRENKMLQNIYNYSRENRFNQAVFFIGAAHRNSIVKKITELVARETLKLNWVFYGSQ